MKKPFNYINYFFILLFVAIVFFSFSADLPRRQSGGFFSDGASYFAITQSLAYDGDIRYGREDIVRIKERFWIGPTGLFLKKAANGNLYFAKSFIYPLFAAPFFRLFDVHGILLLNGLMLFFSLLMTYRLLGRYLSSGQSFTQALVFLLASVAWVYVWWMQPDFFNYFTMLAGLFFFFYPFKRRAWFYLSPVCFAAVVFSKPSNIAPVAVLTLLLIYRREWRRLAVYCLIAASLLGAVVAWSIQQTGDWNFMGGNRRSFIGKFPFEKPEYQFDQADTSVKMTADNYWQRYSLTPSVAAMNLFYYFFGRFTGLFIYFPSAVFLLILFFFQKKNAEDWFMLTAIACGILFLVWGTPDNYFGGSGSLGNRYFLSLMPLFFFLGHKNRKTSLAAAPLALAAIFLTPVFLDGPFYSYTPRFVGTHFPANLFPVEKTQFATLPSNENPHAFFRRIGDRYSLFFLNENFHDLEDDFFWTYGDRKAELLLLAPKPVKRFLVTVTNNPLPNRVYLKIDGQLRRVIMKSKERLVIPFKDIPGFKVSRRWVYHVQVRCERAYSPYFNEAEKGDTRLRLGVQVHFETEE